MPELCHCSVQPLKRGATLDLERLKNILGKVNTKRFPRKKLEGWILARLQGFVTYKAEARGIQADYADPYYTSGKCSRCGRISRRSRSRKLT